MKIYNYDETGKYIGVSEADESPLEKGVYLIPSMATDKQPLAHKDGFDVIWTGSKWEHIEQPKVKPDQPNEYSIWDEASWSWIEDLALKTAYEMRIASKARDEAMMQGFNHNGEQISVTKDDGDGMMQVEATFKRLRDAITNGKLPPETEIKTVIHFKNGTKLPITETEFESFSLLFIIERGKFFQ